MRVDKWLWAVRIYKTRGQAAAACRTGRVKIRGVNAKPSRLVRIGEVITTRKGEHVRKVKVTGLLEHRVGAKLVYDYLEDLSPAAEEIKPEHGGLAPLPRRAKGAGRPAKKDRRTWERSFPR